MSVLANKLYFPVVYSRGTRVPLAVQTKPSTGCLIMAVRPENSGRPRIPAFADYDQAREVLNNAIDSHVEYVIGGKLSYNMSKVPSDHGCFVYLVSPKDIACAVGTYICDLCEYRDAVIHVKSSWSLHNDDPTSRRSGQLSPGCKENNRQM